MMQTHIKKPLKMLLVVDDEIVEELATWCCFELISFEENPDDFEEYTPEEQLEAKFWLMHKYEIMKRLASGLDSLLEQLGKKKVRER
jgi:hypothetical protein